MRMNTRIVRTESEDFDIAVVAGATTITDIIGEYIHNAATRGEYVENITLEFDRQEWEKMAEKIKHQEWEGMSEKIKHVDAGGKARTVKKSRSGASSM